jgi:hypothetical protein
MTATSPPLPGVRRQGGRDRPARIDHCGTGNSASPRFPQDPPEHYDWDRGYAAHLVVLTCMDCGTEVLRYTQLRKLHRPKRRRSLDWRRDPGTWRDIGR